MFNSKKKYSYIIFALVLSFITLFGFSGMEKAKGYNSSENSKLVEIQKLFAKIEENKPPYKVVLLGEKQPDSPFYKNITIKFFNKDKKEVYSVSPKQNAGYDPNIFAGDFTGGKTKQILLSIQSGGSGAFGYFYLYTIKNNAVVTMYDAEMFNKDNVYKATYQNNYKVSVTGNDKLFTIDLSGRDKDYLSQIYTADGKLIKPIDGYVSDLNTLAPVFDYFSNRFNLIALQRITGLYNADLLGYVQTTLSYKDGRFENFNTFVLINSTK